MDNQQLNTLPLPSCSICGTTEQLLRCAKCKTIYYCSTAHQHIDWPTHKRECRLLAKQKNNNKMLQLQQAVAATTLNNTSTHYVTTTNVYSAYQNNHDPNQEQQQKQTHISVIVGNNENVNNQVVSGTKLRNGELLQNGVAQYGNDGTLTAEQHEHRHTIVSSSDANNLLPQNSQSQQTQKLLQHPTYNPHLNNPTQNQIEKSTSYRIGHVDYNVKENANERRYEELCRNIISDMNQYGLSVVDDFLGMEKGLQILNEVHRMYSAGVFKDGQLVNNTEQNLRTIRGDKITWVKGVEPGCSNVGYLINQIDEVICRANTMKNNGKLGNYNIKERTKAMVACYPGSGSHYVMHVDNPNKDGRVITAIYYLNVNWDTSNSGGVLRIFPEPGNTVADIEPKFDRLIFFWSDKRNPHEVQPAHRTRYAITVWYFDAEEREAALNRCKYNNVTNGIKTTTDTAAILKNKNANTNNLLNAAVTSTTPAAAINQSNLNFNPALVNVLTTNANTTITAPADTTTTTPNANEQISANT